jgi:hypothetical protein
MGLWTGQLGIGPWFVFSRLPGDNPIYRGRPSRAQATAALAFAGSMQIELIQPLDDEPSVYRETIDRRGYGFHHFGRATWTYAADRDDYLARGHELALELSLPGGGKLCYIDTGGQLPGFIELMGLTEALAAMFSGFEQAATNWDGRDPIRIVG